MTMTAEYPPPKIKLHDGNTIGVEYSQYPGGHSTQICKGCGDDLKHYKGNTAWLMERDERGGVVRGLSEHMHDHCAEKKLEELREEHTQWWTNEGTQVQFTNWSHEHDGERIVHEEVHSRPKSKRFRWGLA